MIKILKVIQVLNFKEIVRRIFSLMNIQEMKKLLIIKMKNLKLITQQNLKIIKLKNVVKLNRIKL